MLSRKRDTHSRQRRIFSKPKSTSVVLSFRCILKWKAIEKHAVDRRQRADNPQTWLTSRKYREPGVKSYRLRLLPYSYVTLPYLDITLLYLYHISHYSTYSICHITALICHVTLPRHHITLPIPHFTLPYLFHMSRYCTHMSRYPTYISHYTPCSRLHITVLICDCLLNPTMTQTCV